MNAVLTQEDSLRLLRIVRTSPELQLIPCSARSLRTEEAGRCSLDLPLLCAALPEQMRTPAREHPLQVLSFSREARCKSDFVHPSAMLCDPPDNSFLEVARTDEAPLAEGVGSQARLFVETPALSLIRMSHSMERRVRDGAFSHDAALIRLAALAMEMCGTYARDPIDPGRGTTTYDVSPLCSRTELDAFLTQAPRLHGIRLARQATALARDDSGSPHETLLSFAFRLSAQMGGAEFAEPLPNTPLAWPDHARPLLKHHAMRPDFHWPQYLLASEYLGGKHGEGDEYVEDSNRVQDYQSCGYSVFPATYEDIRSTHALGRYLARLVRVMALHEDDRFAREKNELLLDPDVIQARAVLIAHLLPPRR